VVCGTAGYVAPEVLAQQGNAYSSKSDVFSIGAIMYNLLTNKKLFKGKDTKETLKLNQDCNLTKLKTALRDCAPRAVDLI
jgi:serine/threonine protein kinase